MASGKLTMKGQFRWDLAGLIHDAFEEIAELAFDLEEKSENVPEPLQNTDINRRRVATAFILGNLKEPEVPASLRGDAHLVRWSQKRERNRSDRRNNITERLRACVAYLLGLSSSEASKL